jgi:L-aspartate oxidase
MLELGADHVFLDATGLESFDTRFPNIAKELRSVGLDPAKDWLPVAPAAHYTCGGIVTDLRGSSSLPGLWAAGEASCSGVHGANRLASNSLLEGMVFGPRAVEAIEAGASGPEPTGAMRTVMGMDADRPDEVPAGVIGGRFVHLEAIEVIDAAPDDPATLRSQMQRDLTAHAGVLRDAASLDQAAKVVADALAAPRADTVADHEVRNLATVARAAVDAARRREESRGAHTRDDFPETRREFEHRIVFV